MRQVKNFTVGFFLLLSFFNIYIIYVGNNTFKNYLFNSDALYLPTLFSDIFSKGGEIKDWFLTPAPYFFPDYPVFLISYFLGSETYNQIVIYSIIQSILCFLVVWFLAKQILKKNEFFISAVILVVLIWLSLKTDGPFVFLLNSAFHYGIFLVAILFVAFWLRYNSKQYMKNNLLFYLLTGLLVFFSTLSDSLFIVQVIAPLTVTVALYSLKQQDFSLRNKLPLAWVIFFSALGLISYDFIIIKSTRYSAEIGTINFFSNLNNIYTVIYVLLKSSVVSFVFFIFYITFVFRSFFRLLFNKDNNDKLAWLTIFSFLSICSTVCVASLVVNLPLTSRYFISALSWPVIVVFIYLSNCFYKKIIPVGIIISFLLTCILSFESYFIIKDNELIYEHYPSDIACIDEVLKRENVNNGIAQYWDAKYIQNFSRLDLNVAQYFNDLTEMRWITSDKFFKEKYDFAIIAEKAEESYKISSSILKRLNGEPKEIVSCEERTVYIYGKDKLRVK